MVKLVWKESSELSEEHPVFVCKALTIHSWVILHYGCASYAAQRESHAAQRTTHNHKHAHSKQGTTHTQKHDMLPQHQVNIMK